MTTNPNKGAIELPNMPKGGTDDIFGGGANSDALDNIPRAAPKGSEVLRASHDEFENKFVDRTKQQPGKPPQA